MTANLRVFLWAIAGAALFLNYQTWQRDYARLTPALNPSSGTTASTSLDASAPTASAPGGAGTQPGGGVPASAPIAAAAEPTSAAAQLPGLAAAGPAAGSVHVATDVLDVQVSLEGGELERADLLAYPQVKNVPNAPVRLLSRDSADSLFVVQGGLAGTDGEQAPTHRAIYTAPLKELQLAPGEQELRLPLTWDSGHG